VRAIPVFLFFRNREKIHLVKGADMGSLDAAITQHLADATSNQPAGGTEAPKVPGQVSFEGYFFPLKNCEEAFINLENSFSNNEGTQVSPPFSVLQQFFFTRCNKGSLIHCGLLSSTILCLILRRVEVNV